MNLLLGALVRSAFRRGLRGSRGWLITGLIVGGIRTLQRLSSNEAEVLYRTEVKPGDRFEITTHTPAPK